MTDSTSSSAWSDGTMSWELLDRYLAGECTPDEMRIVERAIAAVPDGPALVLELRRGLGVQGKQAFEATARLAELRMRIMEDGGDATPKQVTAQPGWVGKAIFARTVLGTRTLRGWAWAIGSFAAMVAMIFVFRTSSHMPGVTRSYATGAYQQGTLTLVDGTRVTLAPHTTLWLADFGKQHRTVAVDGKAYFEVTNAKGAPFEVRSGAVTARVLGTAFLVDHAPHSSHVRVAVEEGKVRVSSASHADTAFTVTAGAVGEITDSSITVNAVADTESGTEWLPGQLFFHHASVATVLQTLSRWYGYQFRYADSSLSQRSVTISLSVRSPASALATLEQILRVNLTMIGDTVTLTPQAEHRVKGMPKVRSYDVWTPTREVGR